MEIARGYLAAFQLDISHSDMRAKFVFPFALVLQRFSQPAVSFAGAIDVYIANAGACFDQPIAGVVG